MKRDELLLKNYTYIFIYNYIWYVCNCFSCKNTQLWLILEYFFYWYVTTISMQGLHWFKNFTPMLIRVSALIISELEPVVLWRISENSELYKILCYVPNNIVEILKRIKMLLIYLIVVRNCLNSLVFQQMYIDLIWMNEK